MFRFFVIMVQLYGFVFLWLTNKTCTHTVPAYILLQAHAIKFTVKSFLMENLISLVMRCEKTRTHTHSRTIYSLVYSVFQEAD